MFVNEGQATPLYRSVRTVSTEGLSFATGCQITKFHFFAVLDGNHTTGWSAVIPILIQTRY